MDSNHRLHPVPDSFETDPLGYGDAGNGNLETLNHVAQSFQERLNSERSRTRAVEQRVRSYEDRIRELTERLQSLREHEGRAQSLQQEIPKLHKTIQALQTELQKSRTVSTTVQAERDTVRNQIRQYQQTYTAAQKELQELRHRNEQLNHQVRQNRELQEHAVRQVLSELQDLRRKNENSASGTEIRDLIERQVIPACQKLQAELHQSERRTQMDVNQAITRIEGKIESETGALDRMQNQLSEHERGLRKDVKRLNDVVREAITRLGFLDTGSTDFAKLNQHVIRIEKNLSGNERTMAQISYLLQAVGKQQEQANDLFLNHTEVFLKKQMESFRGLVGEVIAQSQRETQRYIRRCFKDMAEGNYEFDDAEGEETNTAGTAAAPTPPPFRNAQIQLQASEPAVTSGSPLVAGPPPGTQPQAPQDRMRHLQSLIDKKDDEIRRTEEKLSSAAPASDAYQKLSLVKELLRTQREHIHKLSEKLARPDAAPERGAEPRDISP